MTSRTTWACPNQCPSVLGPTRPRSDHTCRFCLVCSARATHLVKRAPVTLERKRETKRQRAAAARAVEVAERKEVAARAREKKEASERWQNQANAIDYHVTVEGEIDVSLSARTFDRLRDALGYVRRLRREKKAVVLTCVRGRHTAVAEWHGTTFAGWTRDDGKRIPS